MCRRSAVKKSFQCSEYWGDPLASILALPIGEQERSGKCHVAASVVTNSNTGHCQFGTLPTSNTAAEHEVIESVADVPAVVNQFEQKLSEVQRPDCLPYSA